MPASPHGSHPDAPSPFAPELARRGLRRGLGIVAAVGGALGLSVLAIAQTDVGAQAIADLLQRAQPPLLLLALGSMTLAFLFMGLRWRALMPAGHRPPAAGLMAIVCAGLLLNYALPGPMGELGAAWFAGRRYGVPLAAALASGIAARLVGLATAALTAALVWTVADLPVPAEYERLVGSAVVAIGLGGALLALVTARPEPYPRLARRLLGPLAARRGAWGGRVAALLDTLDRTTDGLVQVGRQGPSAWLAAAAWSAASHASVVTGVALACAAFGASADPAGLLFTYATTTAGAVVLFVLPGSQVGWDALFLGLLMGSAGLPLADAAAVALTVRVHHLGVMVLGALSLVWLLRAPAHEAAEARHAD